MKINKVLKNPDSAEGKSMITVLRQYVNEGDIKTYMVPILGTISLFILGQFISPGFARMQGIFNYMAVASLTMFACIAQSLVMINGRIGFDLSIGALMSVGAAWGASLSGGTDMGVIWSVLAMGGIGAFCGLVSGTCVKILNMPPMVVTMSIGSLVGGGYMAITRGQVAGTQADLFKTIGTGTAFWYIRWVLLIAVAVIVIIELVLRRTKYGKSLFLVGTNEHAAGLCGIKTTRVFILTYMLAGISSALAGLMLFSIVGSTQAGQGDQYTMLSIAAVVIGGVSLVGGKGTYLGAALGALMMTVLAGVLTVIQIPQGARDLLKGLILLSILLVYARSPRLRQ
ncbi:MAG: ABC transporter permease [Deltaproteobacteria bacterium]|jgi:ribose transport system permease protein|nr:ABC transporter permease [Deltaproteobacteria bacterium]